MRPTLWIVALALALLTRPAVAAETSLTLAVDDALSSSGLVAYIVPRFALKHGVRANVVVVASGAALPGDVDVVLSSEPAALSDGRALAPREVFREDRQGGMAYAVAVLTAAPHPDEARLFADWLASDVGRRTVAAFSREGASSFIPVDQVAAAPAVAATPGDASAGERLAIRQCGRCHVVSRRNRFAGIGSTPSFMALRALPGWKAKFANFWTANPHPSFLHVEGTGQPFDPLRPPHIAPVEITRQDVDDILSFVAGIEPLDLGAPIRAR